MPRGGKRNGSGRPKGARNKATADLQDAAREYTPQALETLRSICADGESEAARVQPQTPFSTAATASRQPT